MVDHGYTGWSFSTQYSHQAATTIASQLPISWNKQLDELSLLGYLSCSGPHKICKCSTNSAGVVWLFTRVVSSYIVFQKKPSDVETSDSSTATHFWHSSIVSVKNNHSITEEPTITVRQEPWRKRRKRRSNVYCREPLLGERPTSPRKKMRMATNTK